MTGAKPTMAKVSTIGTSPSPRFQAASVAVAGKILLFGGFTQLGKDVADVDEYDPVANTWNRKTAMPRPLVLMPAVVSGGKVYVVGGRNSGGVQSSIFVYEPLRNSWGVVTSIPALPPLWDEAAAAFGDRIYIIGGIRGTGANRVAVDDVFAYDPAKHTLTTRARLPIAVHGAGIAVLRNKIYVIGGRRTTGTNTGAIKDVQIYDPVSDKWDSGPSLNTARVSVKASVVEGRVYVAGGAASNTSLSSVEVLDPDARNWQVGSQLRLSESRTGHTLTAVGNKVFIMWGSVTPQQFAKSIEVIE